MLGKLIIASFLTGIISGFFIVVYELLIDFLTHFIFRGNPFDTIPSLPVWYIYLVPTVAIFVVNYIRSKDKYIGQYGLIEIAESISENRMTIRLKTLFLKIFASALSISSGFAVGTEGPSSVIGAMVAQKIHALLKMPAMLVKMMISVGASSGIAAIFVSPVTGIAFAIENIAYQFIKQYVGYLIFGSIIAFSISAKFLDSTSFSNSMGKAVDYYYVIPIIIFIPFITAFVYLYLFLKKKLLHLIDLKIFKKFFAYRNLIFSVIGGSVIGTILLLEPHAAFSGKTMVIHLINSKGHIPLHIIFIIIILRIIATTVSIYANAVGGLFLPSMSIGALVGYGYGELITQVHHLPLEPFFFAAVGAAVFMGVIMNLPLTAVVLALETTFDYNVMAATAVSVVLVSYLSSFYFDIRKKYATQADKITKSEKAVVKPFE